MNNNPEAEDILRQWPVSDNQHEKSFFEGWFQVVLIVLNMTITLFFIINDQFRDEKAVRSGFWRMVSIPFTGIFFVECAIVIFSTDGGTIIREKKLYILELICQILSIFAYIKLYSDGSDQDYADGGSLLSFAFMVRNLRVSCLL